MVLMCAISLSEVFCIGTPDYVTVIEHILV